MKYQNIREEELKNKVVQDYFWLYDCSKIIGNVDFCVTIHHSSPTLDDLAVSQESLLWSEAKKGSSDVYKSIAQLILTIGKARTFDKFLPPAMLGAFDGEKIAFIPYNDIHEIFYLNDFNWNVAPSNYETKEFKLIYQSVKNIIDTKTLLFNFLNDDKELNKFIKINFVVSEVGFTKTKIDKNNFMVIYNKWLQNVKASIAVNWDIAKKGGIIDGDFYLADLLSHQNHTLKEKLFVLLKHDHYELDRKLTDAGFFSHGETSFTDKQVAHTQFWNKYERPPKEEYWDYIVERRDLLVPQDVRERKGSFFTPQIWVELSQKYLTDVLGENWQDEYYVWDCAAGTGNLLAGLTNKYNIWASTLDNQDVEVIHDRIKNGANLLDDHVFQFDFLNDDFTKLPKPLQAIINDPIKRKKLVVYINPPYAEVSSVGIKGKAGVNMSKIHDKFSERIGTAGRELYILFLSRIYDEFNGCLIAEFSKLKALQGSAFGNFRNFFKADLLKSFVVPARTFDNVKGNFPIGFKIWDTNNKILFSLTQSNAYNEKVEFIGTKTFSLTEKSDFINNWISNFKIKKDFIGFLAGTNGNDFQQNNIVYILNKKEQMANPRGIWINADNIIPVSIFYSVRRCITQTWLNDRDQFLYPNNGWKTDIEFQNDCLPYTLFNTNIKSEYGTNHWIPFTEYQVGSREKFDSNFMTDYINGKSDISMVEEEDLFGKKNTEASRDNPLIFSIEATEVFNAGKNLWKHYHQQPNCNINASFYDIREYFQGRNLAGKMNNKSDNETYMELLGELRNKLKQIASKIEPKVYEYQFLKA